MFFFFFNDTATTEIYTLSLHDALPIWLHEKVQRNEHRARPDAEPIDSCSRKTSCPVQRRTSRGFLWAPSKYPSVPDRKSTRLNSSHSQISYAVFCLKKKKNTIMLSSQL